MDHNPVVETTGQGKIITPHQGRAVTHLNPEGGPLQAAHTKGHGNYDTSETSGDTRRTPRRGGYCSGSIGTAYGAGRRYIMDEGRASEGVAKGGDKGK